MTLIIAFKNAHGVTIASDSRTIYTSNQTPTVYFDGQKKIFKINEYCAIALHGATNVAINSINSYLKGQPSRTLKYVDDIADSFVSFLIETLPGSVVLSGGAEFGFILVGLDDKHIPRIYGFTNRDLFIKKEYTEMVAAGDHTYAIFLCRLLYSYEVKMPYLVSLAIYLISESARAINTIGGPIQLVTITTNDGYEMFSDRKINAIITANESMTRILKRYFGHNT